MQAPLPLLPITEAMHDVLIDLIYAGADNFTSQVIYEHPLCFLHPQAEACLRKAVVAARELGLRLKVLDAFRPQEAQEALWAVAPLPGYVADPAQGSNHTRGVAIDLTLVGADGQVLDMGTPVDTMTAASHHFYAGHCAAVQINRARLLTVIDYVVVHELCHLRHRDHSAAFWNEVDKVLPDWRARRDWLRVGGAGLDI